MKILLTAADLAARRGVDKEIGLVQQIINWAPEITMIAGRTISGTYTEAKVQTGIPAGGTFPGLNGAVPVAAGTYEMRRFNTYFFDSQLEIREGIIKAAAQAGDSLGDLQADEVAGALQDKAIKFSQQFYQGQGLNANGFFGLKDYLNIFNGATKGYQGVTDSRTGKTMVNTVDAGGTSGATECIWYIWNHPQGIHFLYGGNSMIDINPWVWASLGDSKARYRAQVSNINGFVGLSAANPWCVACIKNIDGTHPVTWDMVRKLKALLPVGIRMTHCFGTPRALSGLAGNATVVLQANQQTGNVKNVANVSMTPDYDPINNCPIYPTDGIQLTATF